MTTRGDAYANGTIFVPCEDGVRALTYKQTARTFTELWHGPADATGPPILSGGPRRSPSKTPPQNGLVELRGTQVT